MSESPVAEGPDVEGRSSVDSTKTTPMSGRPSPHLALVVDVSHQRGAKRMRHFKQTTLSLAAAQALMVLAAAPAMAQQAPAAAASAPAKSQTLETVVVSG